MSMEYFWTYCDVCKERTPHEHRPDDKVVCDRHGYGETESLIKRIRTYRSVYGRTKGIGQVTKGGRDE